MSVIIFVAFTGWLCSSASFRIREYQKVSLGPLTLTSSNDRNSKFIPLGQNDEKHAWKTFDGATRQPPNMGVEPMTFR